MFLVHEARGSGSGARCQGSCHTQWAAYPGESCLISRMWAGNVTHGAVFSGSRGWPGVAFKAPSSPAVGCAWEYWPEGPSPRRPQANVPGSGTGGTPFVRGCLRLLCRAVMGGLFTGTPFSAPEYPSIRVVTGWPVCVLFGHSAGACL